MPGHVHSILISMFVHTSLFMVGHKLRWPWSRSCALPSLFHATVTFGWAAYHASDYLFDPLRINHEPASSLLDPQSYSSPYAFLGSFSVGYMLYDILEMILNDKASAMSVLHHVFVIAANVACSVYGFAQPIMVMAYFEELSTIVLNIPAVLNLPKTSTAYSILKGGFFISFVACRFSIMWIVLFNVPRMWSDLAHSSNSVPAFLALALLLVLMRAVNTYWLFLILRRVCCEATTPWHPSRRKEKQ